MTAPRVLVEHGERETFLAGDMRAIHSAVRSARCPRQYDRRRRAVVVPRRHSDDVLAALELQIGAELVVVETIT